MELRCKLIFGLRLFEYSHRSVNGCLMFLIGQVDLDLLRCQQLKLYILKAGRALLSHQDTLRQILSQPAVQECALNSAGIWKCNLCVSLFA